MKQIVMVLNPFVSFVDHFLAMPG